MTFRGMNLLILLRISDSGSLSHLTKREKKFKMKKKKKKETVCILTGVEIIQSRS